MVGVAAVVVVGGSCGVGVVCELGTCGSSAASFVCMVELEAWL